MEDIKYWIWINSINDVGPIRARKLLQYFKNPKEIWNASFNQLKFIDGIGEHVATEIVNSKDEIKINEEITKIRKNNIKLLTLTNEFYPYLLKKIYDPPTVLYMKGNIEEESKNSVAIVGSRNATHYGLKVAYDFAKKLAKSGITIVSGMARGVDTAAHKGALDAGGKTIAVLGCGLDIVYPRENKALMNQICQNGAVISEFPIGTTPDAKNFPQRNRIVSGLSLGTIIVEASKKSGSLITADFALEHNREVFAIPGQIISRHSEGTNNLIKQGAKLVSNIDEVLEELNIENNTNNQAQTDEGVQYNLNADEKVIFSNISNLPIHLEKIMKHTGFTINKINTIITMLELKGLIKQLPGKEFVRN